MGPHIAFGRDQMGLGTSAWGHAQIARDFELVIRGHGTDCFEYAGSTVVLADVLAGGSVGIRQRYRYKSTTMLGAEAFLDYQGRSGASNTQSVSGIVGIPVAEQAVPGLWVYTDISMGIAIPLEKNPAAPFFGFQEIPLGISWEVSPGLLVVAEGGMSLPLNGGYFGAATAFRF